MKLMLKILAMLLVLLMTLSAVACKNNNGDKTPEESEKHTEEKTEAPTENELSDEEIAQLKQQMSASILLALGNFESGTQKPDDNSGNNPSNPGDKEENTTNITDYIENLLGSLGGLEGDYDYSEIIGGVLDEYIGSENTSDFLNNLIKKWLEDQLDKPTTTGPEEQAPTEPDTNTGDAPAPGDDLMDFVAEQTAKAIADAIVERINQTVNEVLRDAIYDAVYESMSQNGGLMDSILGGLIQ